MYAQLLGNAIVFFTTLLAVVERNNLDPELVGLAVTFALQVFF